MAATIACADADANAALGRLNREQVLINDNNNIPQHTLFQIASGCSIYFAVCIIIVGLPFIRHLDHCAQCTVCRAREVSARSATPRPALRSLGKRPRELEGEGAGIREQTEICLSSVFC